MKRTVSLLLTLVIVIGLITSIPVTSSAANINNLSFYFDNDLYGYVVYECEKGASGSLTIPSTYNGYSVKAIDKYAFYNCQYLTSVTIPNTVTEIYMGAFENCPKLTSVSLGSSVRNIDSDAFYDCVQLSSITFPNSVKIIGQSSFQNCRSLKSVTIPNSVEHLGAYAFMNCTNITNVTMGNGLTCINESSFESCTKLNSVVIGSKVSVIYAYAFANCSKLATVTMPATVKDIGWGSFEGCSNIKKVYYSGTIYNRNNIYVSECNEDLFNAQWVYGSTSNIPAAPKATTTNEINGVNVTWNAVEGAVKYNIYRRQGGSNSWTLVGTTTGTSLTDTKVTSGIYYVYSVRAYNSAGQYSDFVSANTNTRKFMATPKLTTIYNHANGLAIKWNSVPGVTNGYRVYRRGAGSTYWTYLGTTKNLYFIDNAVKNKSGEYFRYTVIADGGYHSKFDTTGLYLKRLANPTLTSAVSSSAGITVKWSAVKGTTGYYVYRKTANSTWVRIAAVGGTNNTAYLDKTAKKGVTYTYTVKAVYGATTSSYNSGISCKDKY